MQWLKNRRNRLMAALAAGIAAAVLLAGVPAVNGNGVLAWWGTMYPRFCFAEMPEDEQTRPGEVQAGDEMSGREIKTTFWIVEVLKGTAARS